MTISDNNNAGNAFESSLNAARKQAIMAGTPYVITKQFPWKLHEMLDVVEQRGETSIVSWLPGGRAFRVHDPNLFVDQIMKKCFNQTKYKSFQRQLNLWGFERIVRESAEKGSYFHPLFLRGRRDLCQEMARQKVKSEKKSSKQTAEGPRHSSNTPTELNKPNPFQLPFAVPPKAGAECVSTDVSSSSSATSSPTQSSVTASRLLASTLPHQQLLPPAHLSTASGLHNPLHMLNALQATSKTFLPSTGIPAQSALSFNVAAPTSAAMGTVLANKPTSAGASVANIAGVSAIAGIQLKQQQQQQQQQQQRFLENALLMHALENQEAQRASSVFLAAALLGNLASPKNSS